MIRALLAAVLLSIACEPRRTTLASWKPDEDASDTSEIDAHTSDPEPGIYIEAEAGELSGGFRALADAAASAGLFLAPPDGVRSEAEPGAARARYDFELARGATYRIWGRIHGPDVAHNRFWFQLDGGAWHKWRISTGDIWYWDDLHEDTEYNRPLEFELSAGPHTLSIANCVDGVGLDRLYVSAAGDRPPGDDTACSPPHSIEVAGRCEASCGSHGKTECGVQACQGRAVIVAYDCAVCCVIE
jgi:hypothetical protein